MATTPELTLTITGGEPLTFLVKHGDYSLIQENIDHPDLQIGITAWTRWILCHANLLPKILAMNTKLKEVDEDHRPLVRFPLPGTPSPGYAHAEIFSIYQDGSREYPKDIFAISLGCMLSLDDIPPLWSHGLISSFSPGVSPRL